MAPRSAWRRSASAVMKGRIVKRVTEGTALMIPIQEASMPIALSQTGKNGVWVPISPNTVP